MSDENTMVAVDSLVANEFQVQISGEVLMGVFRVSGLTTFRAAGNGEHKTFTLAKMVQRDGNNIFNKWLRETVKNAPTGQSATRTVAVIAIDDEIETRRWTVAGARITSVRYSDFDTALSEMVEEIVTIVYDSLEETWSATPNLE